MGPWFPLGWMSGVASAGLVGEVVAEVDGRLGAGGPVIQALGDAGELTDLGRVGFTAVIGTGDVYAVWDPASGEAEVLTEAAVGSPGGTGTLYYARPSEVRIDALGQGWAQTETRYGVYRDEAHWGRVRLGEGLSTVLGESGQRCGWEEGRWQAFGYLTHLFPDGAFLYSGTCSAGSTFAGVFHGSGDGADLAPLLPAGAPVSGVEAANTVSRGFSPGGGASTDALWGWLAYECRPTSACPDLPFGGGDAFVVLTGSAAQVVLRSTDRLPGDPSTRIAYAQNTQVLSVNRSNQALLLVRTYDEVTYVTADALVVASPSGELSVVARDGEPAPGLKGLTLDINGGFLFDDGAVAFHATLIGDGNASTRNALFRSDTPGTTGYTNYWQTSLLDRAGRDLGGGQLLTLEPWDVVANTAGDLLVNIQSGGRGLMFYGRGEREGQAFLFGDEVIDVDGELLPLDHTVNTGARTTGYGTTPVWTTGVDGRALRLDDDRRFVLLSGDRLLRVQVEPDALGELFVGFGACQPSSLGPGPQCGAGQEIALFPEARALGGSVAGAGFTLSFDPPVAEVAGRAAEVICDTEADGDGVSALDCVFVDGPPLLASPGDTASTPVDVVLAGPEPVTATLIGQAYGADGLPTGEPSSTTARLQATATDLDVAASWLPTTDARSCQREGCRTALVTITNAGPLDVWGDTIVVDALVQDSDTGAERNGTLTIFAPCMASKVNFVSCRLPDLLEVGGLAQVFVEVEDLQQGVPVRFGADLVGALDPGDDAVELDFPAPDPAASATEEGKDGCGGCSSGGEPIALALVGLAGPFVRRRSRGSPG